MSGHSGHEAVIVLLLFLTHEIADMSIATVKNEKRESSQREVEQMVKVNTNTKKKQLEYN